MTEVVWAKEDEWEKILEFNIAMAWETERKSLSAEVVELGVKAVFQNSGHGRYVVARIDGELVGQAMITFEWSDWRNGQIWWLQSVYVRPEYRRRGVFREIYRTVERYARETAGVVGIRLYVEAKNEQAMKVYRSLGIKPAGYTVWEQLWNQSN